jgi:general secretion pathway protein G
MQENLNMNRRVRRRPSGKSRRGGFTLMEVLLVLAILVILSTLVVTNFAQVFASSKVKAARAQISAFQTQLDIYQLDIGAYPSSQQGLQALREPPAGLADPSKWNGPYAQKDIPLDPWQNQYIYEQIGPTQYQLYSPGPDGQPGTTDDVGTVSG